MNEAYNCSADCLSNRDEGELDADGQFIRLWSGAEV